jgi:hypothetical protein
VVVRIEDGGRDWLRERLIGCLKEWVARRSLMTTSHRNLTKGTVLLTVIQHSLEIVVHLCVP